MGKMMMIKILIPTKDKTMKKEIEFYVSHGFELVGDKPTSFVNDTQTLCALVFAIAPIDEPDPHAELKAQYVRDLETCATIDGLDAYQLWQYIFRPQQKWFNCEIPPSFEREILRRHPHADSMIEYHRCSDKDKQRWQFKEYNNDWIDLNKHEIPAWYENAEYRIKPRTITINGKEYNAPLNVDPEFQNKYWFVANHNVKMVADNYTWNGDTFDMSCLKNNNCFATQEDCQAVADAFNAILASGK